MHTWFVPRAHAWFVALTHDWFVGYAAFSFICQRIAAARIPECSPKPLCTPGVAQGRQLQWYVIAARYISLSTVCVSRTCFEFLRANIANSVFICSCLISILLVGFPQYFLLRCFSLFVCVSDTKYENKIVCICVCAFVCMHVYVFMHVYECVYMWVGACVCVCVVVGLHLVDPADMTHAWTVAVDVYHTRLTSDALTATTVGALPSWGTHCALRII